MVVRPESPVEYHENIDEEWFKEYEWMNEEDTFEEAYLENLYLEEVRCTTQSHTSVKFLN